MTHDKSNAHLAYAACWLSGFAAAQPEGGERNSVLSMVEHLYGVRRWLTQLLEGKTRMFGAREQAIVISYAEFERLFDGLRDEAGLVDRAYGRDTATTILSEYQAEQRAAGEVIF